MMYSSFRSGALSSQAQRAVGEQSPRHPKFRGCRSVCVCVVALYQVDWLKTYSVEMSSEPRQAALQSHTTTAAAAVTLPPSQSAAILARMGPLFAPSSHYHVVLSPLLHITSGLPCCCAKQIIPNVAPHPPLLLLPGGAVSRQLCLPVMARHPHSPRHNNARKVPKVCVFVCYVLLRSWA